MKADAWHYEICLNCEPGADFNIEISNKYDYAL